MTALHALLEEVKRRQKRSERRSRARSVRRFAQASLASSSCVTPAADRSSEAKKPSCSHAVNESDCCAVTECPDSGASEKGLHHNADHLKLANLTKGSPVHGDLLL